MDDPVTDDTRALLRHLLATFAYRTAKCLREAPPGFADFAPGAGVRTPVELLRHMTGLVHFVHEMLLGPPEQQEPPLDWPGEIDRLQRALHRLDAAIAAAERWKASPLVAVQGPLCDALTHTGQLALLRRLAGSPIERESYPRADIRAGALALA